MTGAWRVARADWPQLIFAALAGLFGSSWFTVEGFARVAAGLGTVISMVEPIIISLLAWTMLRERPGLRLWLGLVISIAGSVVLLWPDIRATTATPVDPAGVLFLLGASTCFAIYTIAGKPLLRRYSSFTVTAWTMLIAAVPVMLMASKPLVTIVTETPMRPWAEIVYLAVFNSILGTMLWNFGARHLPGASAGSFLYLLPVVAVAAGYLLLEEPITAHLVIGGAIMLAGVAVAQSSRSGDAA
jgi:drug/metabolite transporter (DMT)-like permease